MACCQTSVVKTRLSTLLLVSIAVARSLATTAPTASDATTAPTAPTPEPTKSTWDELFEQANGDLGDPLLFHSQSVCLMQWRLGLDSQADTYELYSVRLHCSAVAVDPVLNVQDEFWSTNITTVILSAISLFICKKIGFILSPGIVRGWVATWPISDNVRSLAAGSVSSVRI